jgi:hypothetical protein
MNVEEESHNQFKTLHLRILRTHSRLVEKHGSRSKADEKISAHSSKGTMTPEDITNYAKARKEAYEAYEAHKKWVEAQLKYFQFIENQRMVSGQGK